MRRLFLILLLILLQGCATARSITASHYRIDFSDGVDRLEGILIAKMQLIYTDYKYFFRIIFPALLINKETKKYPDYWFVSFYPKHSLTRLYRYLAVVDKKTGSVRFSDMCHLSEIASLDWVFIRDTDEAPKVLKQ